MYCSLLGIIRERFLLRTAIFDAESALRKVHILLFFQVECSMYMFRNKHRQKDRDRDREKFLS